MKYKKQIKMAACASLGVAIAIGVAHLSGQTMEIEPAKAAAIECQKIGNVYDCTTSSTLAHVTELAKSQGITWHDSAEIETLTIIDKFSTLYPEAKKSVVSDIVRTAKSEHYDNLEYLMKLIQCESQFKSWNTNTKGNTPSNSTDRGLLMWNSYWQKGVSNECAFDTVCATRKAIEYIKAGKQSLWVCDRLIK